MFMHVLFRKFLIVSLILIEIKKEIFATTTIKELSKQIELNILKEFVT